MMIKIPTWKAHVERRMETLTHRFWLVTEESVARISIEPRERGVAVEPTMELDEWQMRQFLQSVVDEAARLGIVALDGATVMEAQRKHLNDMRAIAFKGLGLSAKDANG